MSSVARKRFDENCRDVKRLIEIHGDIAGDAPGRRYGVEVLNKSAIVLITAFWEGYCEDIAAEGLAHLVANCKDSSSLPKELRKRIAAELSKERDDLSVWMLAGDGWRAVLTDRLDRLREERNRRLNTPKTAQIDDLFMSTLGIPTMSQVWYWPRMSARQARDKLDGYVTLRGSIAHRGVGSGSVRKTAVTDYFAHVKRLVGKTGGRVNGHVRAATGSRLF